MAKQPRGKYASTNRYPAARAAAEAQAATPEEKDKNKRRWLLVILLLLLLILKFIGLYYFSDKLGLDTLFNPTPSQGILTPDFPLPTEDPNLFPLPHESGIEVTPPSAGGGAVNLRFYGEVNVDLSENLMALVFKNPDVSNRHVVVQVVIQDKVIAQSGAVPMGFELKVIPLADGARDILAPGMYKGMSYFHLYNPETGEKDIITVNSEVTVRVQE